MRKYLERKCSQVQCSLPLSSALLLLLLLYFPLSSFTISASAQMNAKFGGEFPKASKVFYTDFSDDPWQRASVTFPPSADQPYYLSTCEECGHCKVSMKSRWTMHRFLLLSFVFTSLILLYDLNNKQDLSTPQQSDPAPLKASRAEFEKYLAQWLK